MTTAAYLIAYRNELLNGGMPRHLVDDLVRSAAHLDVESRGLRISHPSTSGPTLQGDEQTPSPQG